MPFSKINIKEWLLYYVGIDWPLLLFIIGVIDVKTYIKIISIIFYFLYIIYKKISLSKKITGPLKFYLIIPFIGIISPLINGSFSVQGYWFGYLFGLLQWVICAAAFYLIYCVVISTSKQKLIKTVEVFFIINIVMSLLQLLMVMIVSKSIFPYWLYDTAGKYGVSTGDKLYGIILNNSINNSAICIIGGIYFLFNEKIKLSILCFFVMLLCTSNLSVIFSLFSLAVIFFLVKRKKVRKNAFLLIGILIIGYPILSPGNMTYINTIFQTFVLHKATKYENPDSFKVLGTNEQLTKWDDSLKLLGIKPEQLKMHYKLAINKEDGRYVERLKELKYVNDKYRTPNSNVAIDQNLLKRSFSILYGVPVDKTPLTIYSKPGKIYSMKQTGYFLMSDYKNFLFGAGMGNFSSKLAIRMTGLELQGKYPQKYVYASPDFIQYHLYEFFYYLCQNVALHSIVNMPYSVYNQIAGEYGLLGTLAFIILYIGFFWKSRNKNGYGKFLLLMLLLFFNVDYWFEMASLTVIFELLMLMDIFVYATNSGNKSASDNRINASL